MACHSRFLSHIHIHLHLSPIRSSSFIHSPPSHSNCCDNLKLQLRPLIIQQRRFSVRRNVLYTRAFDDDSFDMPVLDDWNVDEMDSSPADYVMSSSDGEDSDGEVLLTPVNDLDLPSISSASSNNDSLTVAAHRLATLARERKKHRQMLIPLPLGLVYLGRYYQLLTSFCFVSVGYGIKLADTLDGLAGGTAALAFTGLSIAVLPICSDLAIFGASMAGSCIGFLLHNRYKASVFMGNTGSLALGGALAAMAACTGMFFPLFISSGIFIIEASSIIIQVLYLKVTKGLQGAGWRFLRMPPFHYHLQLRGFREPNIVLGAYLISSVLALLGGYVGLISA